MELTLLGTMRGKEKPPEEQVVVELLAELPLAAHRVERDHDAAGEFLAAIVEEARKARLMSADHFTVDGTLIEAWASLKRFKKKDDDNKTPPDDPGNASVDFHGEKRSNDTHESTTDPDAKLCAEGQGQGGEALVLCARPHREPQRPGTRSPDGRRRRRR